MLIDIGLQWNKLTAINVINMLKYQNEVLNGNNDDFIETNNR